MLCRHRSGKRKSQSQTSGDREGQRRNQVDDHRRHGYFSFGESGRFFWRRAVEPSSPSHYVKKSKWKKKGTEGIFGRSDPNHQTRERGMAGKGWSWFGSRGSSSYTQSSSYNQNPNSTRLCGVELVLPSDTSKSRRWQRRKRDPRDLCVPQHLDEPLGVFYEHLLLRLLKWIFNRGGLWLLPLLWPAQSSCRLKKKKKVFVEETRGMSVSDWWWRTPPNTLIHLLKVAVARLLLLLPSATTRNNQRWKDDPSPEAAKRFREPVKGRRNPGRETGRLHRAVTFPPFFFSYL